MAIASSWSDSVDSQFGLIVGGSEVSFDVRVMFPRDVAAMRTPRIEAYWWPSLGWLVRRFEKLPIYPAPDTDYSVGSYK